MSCGELDPEQVVVGLSDVPAIDVADVAGVDGVDHEMSLLEECVDTVGVSGRGYGVDDEPDHLQEVDGDRRLVRSGSAELGERQFGQLVVGERVRCEEMPILRRRGRRSGPAGR